MKINIANPQTGCQKKIEVEDERQLRTFMDKRIAQEVDASCLGDEYKGYILRITGGSDKQGFPMMQGVATNNRVRLLLDGRQGCFRPRRKGERLRKSVRGCIVANDLSVLNTIIVKKGDNEIAGLTDKTIPLRRGPKRASKIRKLFDLAKEEDVTKFVIRREVARKEPKEGKKDKYSKAPKIQRLITPRRLQHKAQMLRHRQEHRLAVKAEEKRYKAILARYRVLKRKNPNKLVTFADTEAIFRKPKAGKKTAKKTGKK